MIDKNRTSRESGPDTSQPPDQSAQESAVAELRAELEASLSAGFVPDGWTHQLSWQPRGERRIGAAIGAAVVLVLVGVLTGWLNWGWKAGVAGGLAAIGLVMLLSIRSGPHPGDTITESFIPHDETLFELGIAGHELVQVTQSRPSFSRTREATRADRRNVHLMRAGIGALFAYGGVMGLLVESGQSSSGTALRVGSILGAVICAGIAVWYWRLIGRYINAGAVTAETGGESLAGELLDSATTGGSSVEVFASGLLARLPLRAVRVVGPAIILLTGAVGVLVAFALAPHAGQFWSSTLAAADLVVFIVASLRALLLAGFGVVRQDLGALGAALWGLISMGFLLLIAKILGWLDEWAVVILWIKNWIS